MDASMKRLYEMLSGVGWIVRNDLLHVIFLLDKATGLQLQPTSGTLPVACWIIPEKVGSIRGYAKKLRGLVVERHRA
jgi:hypothetical protein